MGIRTVVAILARSARRARLAPAVPNATALPPVSLRAARAARSRRAPPCSRKRRAGRRRGRGRSRVRSRPNVSPADVGEDDVRVGVVGQDVGWVALGAAAGAGVAAVEPVHVLAVVVPNAEHEHHAAAQGLAHGGEAAVG